MGNWAYDKQHTLCANNVSLMVWLGWMGPCKGKWDPLFETIYTVSVFLILSKLFTHSILVSIITLFIIILLLIILKI